MKLNIQINIFQKAKENFNLNKITNIKLDCLFLALFKKGNSIDILMIEYLMIQKCFLIKQKYIFFQNESIHRNQ